MSALTLPRLKNGRPTAAAKAKYEDEVDAWCAALKELKSTLDIEVSSRGWCYILEDHGLKKGDFDRAQKLINDCRKDGRLPMDIVALDGSRAFENLTVIDETSVDEEAEWIISRVEELHRDYNPFSFWEYQDHYIEMWVEKVDLKSLFGPLCSEYRVPIANAKGWSDINSRAEMMRRFADWEAKGKQCVLLYCGDFDPGGLHISDTIRSNFEDVSGAIGWNPDDLIIDRFGLNYDFIIENNLTWIDNLDTAKGGDLSRPSHKDHHKEYVQNYLEKYGARKVEANALVVRAEAGRDLCRRAILRYINTDGKATYERDLEVQQGLTADAVLRLLGDRP